MNYINNQKINDQEIKHYIDVLTHFIKIPGFNVYVKGGGPLALKVLSLIPNLNRTTFISFLQLNLIRDWDFVIVCNSLALQNDLLAHFYKSTDFEHQGHKIILFRYKHDNMMISNKTFLKLLQQQMNVQKILNYR